MVEPDKDIVSSIISNTCQLALQTRTDEDQGTYYNKGKITVAFVEYSEKGKVKIPKKIMEPDTQCCTRSVPGAQIAVTAGKFRDRLCKRILILKWPAIIWIRLLNTADTG